MEGFDLDRYLRASKKVDLSGVPWARIRDTPLPVGEARCLAYMKDTPRRPLRRSVHNGT